MTDGIFIFNEIDEPRGSFEERLMTILEGNFKLFNAFSFFLDDDNDEYGKVNYEQFGM